MKQATIQKALATGVFNTPGKDFLRLEKDICVLARKATTKLVGDVWEVFTWALLRTDPVAMAKNVWPLSEAPQEVLDALNITREDKGVDGVYERRDGTLVAYQAKFRSGRTSLTWEELSTFAGWAEKAAVRLLVTNCDRIADEALSRRNLMAYRGIDLEKLDAKRMDQIKALVRGQVVPVTQLEPRPHQEQATASILRCFNVDDRTTAVMACGTGKTLVGLMVAEQVGARNILVLAPSLALIRQTLDAWASQQKWDNRFRFLCVCSDTTVAGDDHMETRQADLPFQVTTDPEEVRRFLTFNGDPVRVVFSTYQSAKEVAAAMPRGFKFDLGIFDEAHKTAGHSNSLFGFALTDVNLRIRKRLFMTATPRVHSINVKNQITELYSMDDESVYGRRAHSLTFRQAANQGLICPYKVIVSVVTNAEVQGYIDTHDVLVDGHIMTPWHAASQIALAKACAKHGTSKVFTFHHSVKAAREFTALESYGIGHYLPKFKTFHISGEMPTGERARILEQFRRSIWAIISNARCLTEGVDVPAVDMVAFMSVKRSKVDITQAVGRALRNAPGKEYGYVVVPLLVNQEAGESLEDAVDRAKLDVLWDVLQAMMDQDEELVEVINRLRRALVRRGSSKPSLDSFVEVIGPLLDLDTLRAAIETRVVEQLGAEWEDGFAALEEFVKEHAHARVPRDCRVGDVALGDWIHNQRNRRHKLSVDKTKRLEALPGWTWDAKADLFDIGFAVLEKYVEENGHAQVPRDYRVGDLALGIWVSSRRQDRKKDKLSADQIERLEALPGWTWDPYADQFEIGFAALEKYAEENGRTRVPRNYEAGNVKLGDWVGRCRQRKDKLSADKIKRLEALPGWTWDAVAELFDIGFAALQTYVKKYGHARVPLSYETDDGFKLGVWVSSRRVDRKFGTLSTDQLERLNAIPEWVWNAQTDRFEKGFSALLDFIKEHGHSRVARGYKTADGYALDNWVNNLRANKDRLTADQIERLDAIPEWVWKATSGPIPRQLLKAAV
jgi:superfamily II DNA or RNA helicase